MLTGHERLAILRAINADARPFFTNVHLEPGGAADICRKVDGLGLLSMEVRLDDQAVARLSFRLIDRDGRIDLARLGMTDAVTARVRAIWAFLVEQMKLAADREEREGAIEEGGLDMEWCDQVEAADSGGLDMEWCDQVEAADSGDLAELAARCRRIMLEIVLDPILSPDEIETFVNGAAGVGMCYVAAFELGLVALRDGAEPETFRFPDLIAPDIVQELIRDAEKATWTIQLPLSGHDRIRLGAELRRIDRAA